jgi:glucose/arabinose dehydrogenase
MTVNRIAGTLAADTLNGTARADLIEGAAAGLTTAAPVSFATVASSLGRALFAAAAPGESGALLVLDKVGVIRRVDTATGSVQPFLDIRAHVNASGEQGLLGLAHHPDFAENGLFYVFFSNLAGDTVLREYRMDPADPGRVLLSSARDLLVVPQPGTATNHKAGWIGFGPDGKLYLATGDGGGGGDPLGTGQDPSDLLGSILRLDVASDGFPADPARNYAIPADNPFATGGGAPEVWAYGLRNPFRNSFDQGTGTLWIADVGQGRREEINLGAAGANYGWSDFEGSITYPGGTPATPPPGATFPAFEYVHDAGDRSVTGGYVYRGTATGLQGKYVFGDFVSGRIWALRDANGNGVLESSERRLLTETAIGPFQLTSFAEDAEGQLYAITLDGRLLRINTGAATRPLDGADTINAAGGDDRVFAGSGNDSVLGGLGDDLLSGMEGNDTLLGGAGDDTLAGGDGQDVLAGGAGNDLLMGGAGNDRLLGGDGNDVLSGGAGSDVLSGGAGADRFRWAGASESPVSAPSDRVADFSRAEGDVLDLSGLVTGQLTFIGSGSFAATGGQVRVLAAGVNTRVEVSLDGGPADFTALVLGFAGALVAEDFWL